MTLSLTLAILWVLASTILACLPVEQQFRPASLLLIIAPALIWALARDFGALPGIAATMAFLSMYRNPLRYLWRRARAMYEGGMPE